MGLGIQNICSWSISKYDSKYWYLPLKASGDLKECLLSHPNLSKIKWVAPRQMDFVAVGIPESFASAFSAPDRNLILSQHNPNPWLGQHLSHATLGVFAKVP